MHDHLYDDPILYDALMPEGPCAAFYGGFAARARGPVLELACGTGRLTLPMARAGANVTAVDLSPAMLESARGKARRQGLGVEFVQNDMRRFSFDRQFGLIVICCNSLGHLLDDADVDDVLTRAARHLAPGGFFVFDIVNPCPRRLADASPRSAGHASLIAIEETATYDAARQVQSFEWRLGARRPLRFELRVFFPREVETLLARSGLRLDERFGDFMRMPFASASPLQVCVASAA